MKRGAFLAAFLAAPGIAQVRPETKRLVRECRRSLALWLCLKAQSLTPDDDVETHVGFFRLFRAMSKY